VPHLHISGIWTSDLGTERWYQSEHGVEAPRPTWDRRLVLPFVLEVAAA
jgi:hypothetical protein